MPKQPIEVDRLRPGGMYIFFSILLAIPSGFFPELPLFLIVTILPETMLFWLYYGLH
jgi:hypothetical protein